jgi:hypothetical protein
MGINDIKLTSELLAALYPDSLVLVPDQQQRISEEMPEKAEKKREEKSEKKPLAPVYRFLGNNKRRISVIVHHPEAVFLPEEDLAFLGKMFSACHCAIEDIAVLNTFTTPLEFTELKKQLNPEKLLLCDLPAASLNIPELTESFTVTSFQDVSVLMLPSLSSVNQDTAEGIQLKKKLWSSLKKLFSL